MQGISEKQSRWRNIAAAVTLLFGVVVAVHVGTALVETDARIAEEISRVSQLAAAEEAAKAAESQLAAVLQSASSYGEQLGSTVHDSVLNIRANVPNSLITHADVLAIMCIELPSFKINTCSSASACGLTQVTGGTFTGYVGNNAGGCGYLKSMGATSKGTLRTNPRISIETGACIYNDLLKKYRGDRHEAYRAYNAGPGRRNIPEAHRNANTFESCRGAILQGGLPAKASHNPPVWRTLMAKVSQLTGGTFKTDDAQHVPISKSGWPDVALNPAERFQQITGLPLSSNSALGRFLGIPSSSGGGSRGGGSSGGGSGSSVTPRSIQQQPILRSTPTSSTTDRDTEDFNESFFDDDDDKGTTTPSRTPTFATPQPTGSQNIQDQNPTLLCLPNVIDQDEEAIIMYTCRDGSATATLTSSQGTPLTQSNDPLGTLRTTTDTTTTYTLACSEGTAASCTIQVANPALAIIPEPRSARRGQTITLDWKTKDTNSCVVTSNDPIHRTWERQGTEGKAITPTLTQNTTFTLTCETTTGQIEERSVSVGVN